MQRQRHHALRHIAASAEAGKPAVCGRAAAAALGRIELYQGDGPLPAQSAAAFRPGGVRQKERQQCGRDTHGPWSKRRPAAYALATQIGALFAAPVLAQVPPNLASGAYTDRIGGRRIMLGSCWAIVVAGVWLMFAHGFWMLVLGQLALVLSRAAFWPATWALASELPGERGIQLGRLNAATNIGQIAGTALCGFLLAAVGFQPTFLALAGTGLMAFLAGLGTKPATRRPAVGHNLLVGYWRLLHQRIIQYSMLCAYLRSEEHTSELQSPCNLVCRLLLEKKKKKKYKVLSSQTNEMSK